MNKLNLNDSTLISLSLSFHTKLPSMVMTGLGSMACGKDMQNYTQMMI